MILISAINHTSHIWHHTLAIERLYILHVNQIVTHRKYSVIANQNDLDLSACGEQRVWLLV